MTWPLTRGQVVQVKFPHLDEPKLFVVVSNNRRNQALPSALGVRLTTSPKPAIPSIVELGHPESLVGRVLCDDITEIFEDEVLGLKGGLTAAGLNAVDAGLRAALGL